MAKRKAIGRKLRFEVFKRDGFSCAYCGATPLDSKLQVDHIIAVSNGGSNDIDNLVTACQPCNIGKSNIPLSSAPEGLAQRGESIAEHEAQIKEYEKIVRARKRRRKRVVDAIEKAFKEHHPKYGFTESFRSDIEKSFIDKLLADDLVEYMHIACRNIEGHESVPRYFCGICWKKMRGE
jgi:hypothetical protein